MRLAKIELAIGLDGAPQIRTGTRRVEAFVRGAWGAHRSITTKRRGWDVTYVPRGECIGEITGPLTKAQALRVADRLGRLLPTLDDPDAQWVAEALMAEALAGGCP